MASRHSITRHETRRVAILTAAGVLLGGIVMPQLLGMFDIGDTTLTVDGPLDPGELAIAIVILAAGCTVWRAAWPRRIARHPLAPRILQGVSITVGIIAATSLTVDVPWLSVTILFGGVMGQAFVYCWRSMS